MSFSFTKIIIIILYPITLRFCFWRQVSAKSATFLLRLSLYVVHLVRLPPILYNINRVISRDCLLTDMDALLVFITTAVILLRFFVIVGSNTVFTKCHWFIYLNLVLIFVLKKNFNTISLNRVEISPYFFNYLRLRVSTRTVYCFSVYVYLYSNCVFTFLSYYHSVVKY